MRLGLFQSINPVIKYQPGKVNIVADALSRSQRRMPEEQANTLDADAIMALTTAGAVIGLEECSR